MSKHLLSMTIAAGIALISSAHAQVRGFDQDNGNKNFDTQVIPAFPNGRPPVVRRPPDFGGPPPGSIGSPWRSDGPPARYYGSPRQAYTPPPPRYYGPPPRVYAPPPRPYYAPRPVPRYYGYRYVVPAPRYYGPPPGYGYYDPRPRIPGVYIPPPPVYW